MINDIYRRSELIRMAQKMGVDPNDYVQQVVREYPEVNIMDDLKVKLSNKEIKELAKRRRTLERVRSRDKKNKKYR